MMVTAVIVLALAAAFVFILVLILFFGEVTRRYRQCGSLRRALLEAHVAEPLGVYEVSVFGSIPSRLRLFREDERSGKPASLIFEIGRGGWFTIDRYEYAVAREDWRELAKLLRLAAGEWDGR